MRDAFVRKLEELASRDPRVFLITADLGFGVLTNFAKQFPKQFLNVGIAEQNMIGVATGLALDGRIVFTYSIANFPTLRCLEQIRNDACYHNADVKIVSVGGGFSYGALGVSHHATEDLTILRALPEITIAVPGDEWEAEEATKAILNTKGTCYLRLDKSKADISARPGEVFSLGEIRTIRDGTDATLITAGGILGTVLDAAATLSKSGVSCRVLSVHTIKPIDRETLCRAAAETRVVVTVEEHTVHGGLGGLVAEILMENGVTLKKFTRLGLQDEFSSVVGSQQYLRKRYGLDERAIVAAVLDAVGKPQ